MLAVLAAAARRCGELIDGGPQRLQSSRAAAFAAVAALVVIAGTPMAQATTPAKASHFVLGNGMEVVVVPNDRVPVVTQQVWYKVGGAEDPDGQPGLAHFLEHLMFKGTERFPGNSFERFAVANGGASINAFTTQDFTVYPQTLPKKHLAALMELEADRMVNLQLSDEHVKSELRVVQNERRGNDNMPSYALIERVNAALFPGHPYGRSVIGTEAQIATLDRSKALDFYKRYYAPNNAILVVAGDATEAEVRTLAESTFGRIPAKADLAKRVAQPVPAAPAAKRIEVEHERVTTPTVAMYYTTPGVGVLPLADAYAFDLLERIAGSSITGRFYRSLISDKRLSIGITVSHSYDWRGSVLTFAATAAPGVSAKDMETALAQEVAALARDGVTEAELTDARQGYLAAKAYTDDNHRSRANNYGRALARGLSFTDAEKGDDLVKGTTVADVNRLLARYVAKTEAVVGVLRPIAR
jgi:zinc protease